MYSVPAAGWDTVTSQLQVTCLGSLGDHLHAYKTFVQPSHTDPKSVAFCGHWNPTRARQSQQQLSGRNTTHKVQRKQKYSNYWRRTRTELHSLTRTWEPVWDTQADLFSCTLAKIAQPCLLTILIHRNPL